MNSPLGALFSAIDTLQKAFDQVEARLKENKETYRTFKSWLRF
jgi:hypothetical protein